MSDGAVSVCAFSALGQWTNSVDLLYRSCGDYDQPKVMCAYAHGHQCENRLETSDSELIVRGGRMLDFNLQESPQPRKTPKYISLS